ncbi:MULTISPECIES: hypothetical protein [unclassified Methylobacterium]|jgi:hypothetical protein|uniref:hypothetical protein n=1 Tax=unclassified Methylobacterium TaxID=2615210 RepID=UPI00135560E1|nr:hypothetical protein [Methylobacterium sp. 2A]MWV20635.1 hypothetical protein [Methylobacterium sp. 2A]
MSVYVFGDSHGQYLFARAGAATAYCLPGHTMHRAGRDGVQQLLASIKPAPGDDYIFVFGEIDVRRHLIRVAGEKGWTYQEAVTDLADRYFAALHAALDALEPRPRVSLLGVVPPFNPPRGAHAQQPHGPLRDRLVVWYLLNEALKLRAGEAGFHFIPIPKIYYARDASLKLRYSDGFAHIAKDCTKPFVRAVEKELGVDLSFRPLPRRRHLLRSVMRQIAVVNDDWHALWFLGESLIDA